MTLKKNKRRTFMIDPVFQYGLIRKISIIAVLIVVMSLSFIVIVHYLYGDVQIEVVQPDPFALSGSVAALPLQASLLTLIWPVLLVCVLVALAITYFYGVIISHRMAGPIFRIRNELNQMGRGDLTGQIVLRRKDDFKALAESTNDLINSWRTRITALKEVCRDVEAGDGKIQKEHLKRFNEMLSAFKVE